MMLLTRVLMRQFSGPLLPISTIKKANIRRLLTTSSKQLHLSPSSMRSGITWEFFTKDANSPRRHLLLMREFSRLRKAKKMPRIASWLSSPPCMSNACLNRASYLLWSTLSTACLTLLQFFVNTNKFTNLKPLLSNRRWTKARPTLEVDRVDNLVRAKLETTWTWEFKTWLELTPC